MKHDIKVNETLYKNLYDNRNQNLCCDLLLITKNNIRIPVHKIILLSSTSLYLHTLIQGKLNESELHLQIDSKQLEIIVKYLYTGDVNVTEINETKDLYENAKTFKLTFLEEYSTNKLINSITIDFVLEYFRHSVKYSIQNLEEKCLDFIADHTEEFLNKFIEVLTGNELEKIIGIRTKLNIEEIDLYRNIKKWIFMKYDIRKYYIDKILLQYIDFLEIPSKNFHDEIEQDVELANNNNFLKKIMSINKIKEKSILKRLIVKENYSYIGQDSLYHITSNGVVISKINIEEENVILEYKNRTYLDRYGYGIGNFKYDNRDYLLFSGGADMRQTGKPDNFNLIWSSNNIQNDGNLKKFPPLLNGRAAHQTIYFDRKIYVCGGSTNLVVNRQDRYTKSSEIFYFGSEKWCKGSEFFNSKKYFGLTSIDRCLYAVGGHVNKSYVEILDPRVNKWTVISTLYEETCRKAFPCFDSAILCLSKTGYSFIFDIRNNKFTNDIHYNCMENFILLDVTKFNNEIYGFYRKDSNLNIYIQKYDGNYKKDWKILKNKFENNWFGLLTMND